MKELTTEEKLQQKFEELGRPIFAEDIGEDSFDFFSISEENSCFFYPNNTDILNINYDYRQAFYPKNEKRNFIYNWLRQKLREKDKLNAKELFELINLKFIEFYNLKIIIPKVAGNKNYDLDLFSGTKINLDAFWEKFVDYSKEIDSEQQAYPFDEDKIEELKNKQRQSEEQAERHSDLAIEEKSSDVFIYFLKYLEDEFSDIIMLNSIGNTTFILKKNNSADRKRKLFEIVLKTLLKKTGQFNISISNLVFHIGSSELPEDIVKPISKKELRELVIDSDYFVYNEDDDSVRFLSDEELITKIQKYFAARTVNFDIFDDEINKTGILALVFTGNKAPIEEMKDYIIVRPILYITNLSTATTKEDIFLLIKEITEDEGNDIKFLKCLFNNNEEYQSWLENNTALSFFEADEMLVKHIYAKLVNELSPISNLTHNAGNLLQYTLKLNLQNHLSVNLLKVSEKKDD